MILLTSKKQSYSTMSLNNFVIALLLITGLNACKIQAPQFVRYDNLKYESIGMSGFKIGTEVVFHNPNQLKFKIQNVGLDLYLDNKKMAAINEKREILVKRRSDFAIPISVTIKPEMSILDGLKEIYKAFTSREMDLRINGGVGIKWLFLKKSLAIDINKKVKFK